ncbi:quinon protein alcohol dehydrogenase-like superfamily [Pelagophyceae sp. CCMP2097]|nr:quinon protein alcohol dehydrogenase-like superfamily [Pelagophyceae sp. CCMP2097]
MNYHLTRVCGAVHSRGNVVFSNDDVLFSAIGNRVSYVDVRRSSTNCVGGDFEGRNDIDRIAMTSDGILMLAIDVEGRAVAINVPRKVVLHRLNFGSQVGDAKFSPTDEMVAVAVKRQVEVWRAPARRRRELAPFSKLCSLGGFARDVTCVAWSKDSKLLAAGSEDNTVRVFLVPNALTDEDSDDEGEKKAMKPFVLSAHKAPVVGVYWCGPSGSDLLTVARDCVCILWKQNSKVQTTDDMDEMKQRRFKLSAKKFLWGDAKSTDKDSMAKQHDARLVAADCKLSPPLLVAAFSTGVFAVYDLSSVEFVTGEETKNANFCDCIHRLSVARGEIDAIALNSTGEWIAMASKRFGQLVVWEWQSETFVLKQQGHDHEATCVAWSADGRLVASGATDAKVKLWSESTGLCFATFQDHTAPVTAVVFGGDNVLFSASLDGTVQCYDVQRYRNFRTLRTPPPRHVSSDLEARAILGGLATEGAALTSLAVDGEIVVAGSNEPFEIYVWSLRTGKILDALAAHTAPISCLALDPKGGALASASWDKTVRMWNVYRNEHTEKLDHPTEVLSVAYRRDGGELATACLDGCIYVWDSENAKLIHTIDCKRDLANDDLYVSAVKRAQRTRYFDSLAYSADGRCVLAGGRSRFVCVYAVQHKVLVKKFRVSHHRRAMANADDDESDGEDDERERHMDQDDADDDSALPGAKRSRAAGATLARATGRVSAVAFSPTGTAFVCVVPGALLIFTLDDRSHFAPFDIDESVTLETTQAALDAGERARAVVMALQLGDALMLDTVVAAVDIAELEVVVRGVPASRCSKLLDVVARRLDDSPHLEFYSKWVLEVLRAHGSTLGKDHSATLRAADKALRAHQKTLLSLVDDNDFALAYLAAEDPPTVRAP